MKSIYEIKAKKTMAAPGAWAYEAEAKVTGPDTEEEVFVLVGEYDGFRNYQVNKASAMNEETAGEADDAAFDEVFEQMRRWQKGEDVDFGTDGTEDPAEAYEKLSETKGSAYYPVFKVLDAVLKAMEKEIG